MSIQQNRAHAERIKNRRKNYSAVQHIGLGKVSCTPANCSCWMCGNPRKFFKEITQQEKKFLDIEKEYLD